IEGVVRVSGLTTRRYTSSGLPGRWAGRAVQLDLRRQSDIYDMSPSSEPGHSVPSPLGTQAGSVHARPTHSRRRCLFEPRPRGVPRPGRGRGRGRDRRRNGGDGAGGGAGDGTGAGGVGGGRFGWCCGRRAADHVARRALGGRSEWPGCPRLLGMIDVRRLQLLQALAQHHTVAGTAEALNVTPSAVSQQLAALSKETGVALVERRGRRFLLTGAGRVLLKHADVIFAEMESAEADLAAYTEGSVGVARVGSFATGISGLVGPAVAALGRSHPGWSFEIVQAEPEESTELLRTGALDMAVTMSSVH